jgi:hypothetical protein
MRHQAVPRRRQTVALRPEALEPRCLLTAEIRGQVFQDADRDGSQDAGEPGQIGWTVYSDVNNNGLRDAGEPTAGTAANGQYSLPGLAAGRHIIRLAPRYDQSATQPLFAVRPVDVTTGVVANQNFGVAQPAGSVLPNFSLTNVNPNSGTASPVSPRDYLGQVSAWYFIHST